MFSIVIQPKCSSQQKFSLCLCFVTGNLKNDHNESDRKT